MASTVKSFVRRLHLEVEILERELREAREGKASGRRGTPEYWDSEVRSATNKLARAVERLAHWSGVQGG